MAKINAYLFAEFFKVRVVWPTTFLEIEGLSEFLGKRAVNDKNLAGVAVAGQIASIGNRYTPG